MEILLFLAMVFLLYYGIQALMAARDGCLTILVILVLISALLFGGAAFHPDGSDGVRRWSEGLRTR